MKSCGLRSGPVEKSGEVVPTTGIKIFGGEDAGLEIDSMAGPSTVEGPPTGDLVSTSRETRFGSGQSEGPL